MRRRKLAFFTDDPDGLQARAIMSPDDEPHLILGELLAGYPGVLSAEPLTEDHLNTHVKDLDITASLPDPDRAGIPCPAWGRGRPRGPARTPGIRRPAPEQVRRPIARPPRNPGFQPP